MLETTGEMAEWSIAAVLKTVELRGSGGSNPSLSAKGYRVSVAFFYLYRFMGQDMSCLCPFVIDDMLEGAECFFSSFFFME